MTKESMYGYPEEPDNPADADVEDNDPERTVRTPLVFDVPDITATTDHHMDNHQDPNQPSAWEARQAPTWNKAPDDALYSGKADSRPLAYFPNKVSTLPPPPLSKESAARERVRRRHARGRKAGGEWAWVIIAGAMLTVGLLVGMSIFLLVRSTQAEQPPVIPTSVANFSVLPTAVSARTDENLLETGRSITLDNGYSMVLRPWDGETRYTVLLMGLDRRPGQTGLTYLTDTILLVSLDPATGRLGILSIPRDLFVAIPGFSARQRVNTAMSLGEINNGNGPDLAMRTVQYNLGMYVHDYIVADFNAVTTIIDAIGGITVTTDYTINDPRYPDMYYGYDPFYLEAGTHQLDGATALKFARTRHGDNDIERARRQQQVLYAIRDQVLNLDQLPQLVIRAPSLLNELNENVYTSLSLDRMIELAWYAKDIPAENITTGVIGFEHTLNYTTAEGAQVLIPNNNTLPSLLTSVFGSNYSE